MNKAIDNQDEGIMLKNVMSIYKPNNRKGGWYKIKPEVLISFYFILTHIKLFFYLLKFELQYTEGVMNELDFLIIGGYYIENKRYSEIGSVLLGVADTLKNEGSNPYLFILFKIFFYALIYFKCFL